MSKVQVLVAAVNQDCFSLLEKMNINSDTIIGNQCNENRIENFAYHGHEIKVYSFAEKGVGLNRNNTLMRASGDICLFADDDMRYVDNYVQIVEEAFEKNPDADVIAFNLIEKAPTRYIIKSQERIGYLNYLRYGTARIAVKTKRIKEEGIFFNLCFGGGTEHCHGEDNLFLTECLKKGLKMYAVPEYIAELTEERESTWNVGYNDKYFKDQGSLYYAISKKVWKLLCFQDALRHRKQYGMSLLKAYKKMTDIGVKETDGRIKKK